MEVLVAAATALELAAVYGRPELARTLRQGETRTIDLCGRPTLALVTGIGVVNAALELGRACGGVLGVAHFGVAGSFDLGAHPLGAVRLVTAETWPEYGLYFTGAASADDRALGFPLCPAEAGAQAVYGSLEWDGPAGLAALGLAPTDESGRAWAEATSLTVSGVSADPERARALYDRHGAGLENMEGFALAYGAKRAGLPFAEIRAVSNAVGGRPPVDWDLPGALLALGRAARRLFGASGVNLQPADQDTA